MTEGITQKQTAAKELSVDVTPSTSLTTVEKERSNKRIQSARQKEQERAQARASKRRVTFVMMAADMPGVLMEAAHPAVAVLIFYSVMLPDLKISWQCICRGFGILLGL